LVHYQTRSDGEDYEDDGVSYKRYVEENGAMTSHGAIEQNLFSFKDCPSLTTVTIGPNVTSLPRMLIDELLAMPNLPLVPRALLRRLHSKERKNGIFRRGRRSRTRATKNAPGAR
jgi:hypothetical protein